MARATNEPLPQDKGVITGLDSSEPGNLIIEKPLNMTSLYEEMKKIKQTLKVII
jgi:hypothetical protein